MALFYFILENRRYFPVFLGEGYYGPLTSELIGHRFFCGSGWDTFAIMPNGDVAGCPAFESQCQWVEGNVRQHTLKWLWKNKFERFRDIRYLPQDCHECEYLDACGGGCWMMRRTSGHCLKEIWIEKKF
jgi:radical SAM protein with 4Fe4S-binding SPASM domain